LLFYCRRWSANQNISCPLSGVESIVKYSQNIFAERNILIVFARTETFCLFPPKNARKQKCLDYFCEKKIFAIGEKIVFSNLPSSLLDSTTSKHEIFFLSSVHEASLIPVDSVCVEMNLPCSVSLQGTHFLVVLA
jgi:hypothetical protein